MKYFTDIKTSFTYEEIDGKKLKMVVSIDEKSNTICLAGYDEQTDKLYIFDVKDIITGQDNKIAHH